MSDILVYHNGECSKSKCALELIQQTGMSYDVRFYLADPLSPEELKALLTRLNVPVSEVIRTNEPLFIEKFANATLTDEQWIGVLAEHPQLLQRPIVEKGDKAIIARPPEKVLKFIK